MKLCIGCGVEKPVNHFYRARAHRDGRGTYCKPCANARANAWHRANDPKHPRIPEPLAARLLSHVVKQESGCWLWQGARGGDGSYGAIGVGSMRDGSRRMEYAHRVSYSVFVGPIPDGLQIDHLCNNKRCVNPEHLEPVTRGENQRRANAGREAEAS